MGPFSYVAIALVVIILLALLWARTPKGKGVVGEWRVRIRIGRSKQGKRYVLHNYMVQVNGKSSQIDHIVIDPRGIFVIETKNYAGRIYGKDDQQEWMQVLQYGKIKNRFYNPVKQNATHLYRLKQILPINVPMYSVVVFVQNNTRYIESQNVYPMSALKRILRLDGAQVLSTEQMETLYRVLLEAGKSCTVSAKEHIVEIQQMKADVENLICPRCGGKLVERMGKYGRFYGCENYPNCKFVKKVLPHGRVDD